jgi:hypothetical protein
LKALRLALGFILVLFFPTFVRAQERFEVFGGYSYLRASASETGTPILQLALLVEPCLPGLRVALGAR